MSCSPKLILYHYNYAEDWNNGYYHDFTRECGDNEAFFYIRSIHDNDIEDRRYNFDCKKISRKKNECDGWRKLNDHNQNFDYQCDQKFVSGIRSTFNEHHKDRSFSIKCCRNSEVELTMCRKTKHNIGQYDGRFDFELEENQIFTGFRSEHHDVFE